MHIGACLARNSTTLRSHKPAPAWSVSSTCSKGESSGAIAAAIPPWAQSLADKERLSLVIKPTRK